MPEQQMNDLIHESLELQDIAASTALALKHVTHGIPFGPEHDVYKLHGKVFMMTTDVPGIPIITVKCNPWISQGLREEYPSITAGYHMNKRHWISMSAGPGIIPDLVRELVEESYWLVFDGFPKHLQSQLQR